MKFKINGLKAQSVIEFFILVLFIFFVFFGLVFVVYSNIADKNKEKIDLKINELAFSVRDEINLAASSSEGYHREFNIPMKISDKEYEINITEGNVYVRTNDGKFATALAVLDTEGNLKKGTNIIKKLNESIILN